MPVFGSLFGGRRRSVTRSTFDGRNSITASAARLNLRDRTEARRVRQLKQGWQEDAWAYRDSIGEIRYANEFVANAASRMRVFPAVVNPAEPFGEPLPIADVPGVPPEVVESAIRSMNDLAASRLSMSELMHTLSTNISVAGEAFVVGVTDPETMVDEWRIRSVDELMVRNDRYALREVPLDPQGVFGWIELDPDWSYVARIWRSHPRFELLADSPMRAIMDVCEELLILSRSVRAVGRSRLTAGILKVPNSLSTTSSTDDNQDPESDPFIARLGEAMMLPISDEGTASAIVPLVVRGDADALKAMEMLSLARPIDEVTMKLRPELIGRIATGLDLPREVLLGIADLNHWSAWQVDDNTFRHHLEPHVVQLVDCLSVGYLRPAMEQDADEQGWDAPTRAWIDLACAWYDPTELVTHPDRSGDAILAYDRKELSGAALREAMGWTEADAPGSLEMAQRIVASTRTWPANALIALLARTDESLRIPPISTSGTIPGITSAGQASLPPAVVPVESAAGGSTETPPSSSTSPATPPSGGSEPGPPTTPPPSPPGSATSAVPTTLDEIPSELLAQAIAEFLGSQPPEVTRAVAPRDRITPQSARLSRKLVDVERDLRSRIQVACSAALARAMERAGARLRSQVNSSKDRDIVASIRPIRNRDLVAFVSRRAPGQFVFSGMEDAEWAEFEPQFDAMVKAATENSLSIAQELAAGIPSTSMTEARQAFAGQRTKAWDALNDAMKTLAEKALDASESSITNGTLAPIDPETLMPTGTVRAVLSIAGGSSDDSAAAGIVDGVGTLSIADGSTGITAGPIISSALADGGMGQAGWEWIHGTADRSFEPHVDLDGLEFTAWDDASLANGSDWPEVAYFAPGDHPGCTCDFAVQWVQSDDADSSSDADASPDDQ